MTLASTEMAMSSRRQTPRPAITRSWNTYTPGRASVTPVEVAREGRGRRRADADDRGRAGLPRAGVRGARTTARAPAPPSRRSPPATGSGTRRRHGSSRRAAPRPRRRAGPGRSRPAAALRGRRPARRPSLSISINAGKRIAARCAAARRRRARGFELSRMICRSAPRRRSSVDARRASPARCRPHRGCR